METHSEKLQRLEEELRKAREEYENRQREPQGGVWWVDLGGRVHSNPSSYHTRHAGVERTTKELAEATAESILIHNRALAYVHEHAPDWEPDWYSGEVYSVFYSKSQGWWSTQVGFQPIGTVIGPKRVMQQLAEDLNNGRVKL